MIRLLMPFALIAFLAGILSDTSAAAADDKTEYKLRLKDPVKGMVVKESELGKKNQKAVFQPENGEKKETEVDETEEFSITETILEIQESDKKTSKFEFVYDKYSKKETGKADDVSLLVGKKIIAEKKGDKFKFQTKAKLSPADHAQLESQFNDKSSGTDSDFLPLKAVRVNETWEMDINLIK